MDKRELLRACIALRDNPEKCDKTVGICTNLVYITKAKHDRFRRRGSGPYQTLDMGNIAAMWPKFSGNEKFPVPAVKFKCPVQEYNQRSNKWAGEYGALRRELLDFIIDTLKRIAVDTARMAGAPATPAAAQEAGT